MWRRDIKAANCLVAKSLASNDDNENGEIDSTYINLMKILNIMYLQSGPVQSVCHFDILLPMKCLECLVKAYKRRYIRQGSGHQPFTTYLKISQPSKYDCGIGYKFNLKNSHAVRNNHESQIIVDAIIYINEALKYS